MSRISVGAGVVLLLGGVLAMVGQTKVSLKDQSREVDFANASMTRLKTGVTLPAQCSVGELFFNSAATPPTNLFGCVATNSWLAMGGSGSGSASELPTVAGQTGRVLTTDGALVRWQFLDGDVSGAPEAIRVTRLQNRFVGDIAPADGQTLTWNATATRWEPQTPASGSGTNITLQNNGTAVGIQPTWNVLPGTGLVWTLSDTGSALTLQASVDTAVMQTRNSAQAGSFVYCPATGAGAGTQYSCSLSPVLPVYTTGMVIHFQPSVDNGAGPITLNIDGLGTRTVKLQDGTTDPAAGDFLADQLYGLWYDGTQFRRMW